MALNKFGLHLYIQKAQLIGDILPITKQSLFT